MREMDIKLRPQPQQGKAQHQHHEKTSQLTHFV
jgi:hypothetical protein